MICRAERTLGELGVDRFSRDDVAPAQVVAQFRLIAPGPHAFRGRPGRPHPQDRGNRLSEQPVSATLMRTGKIDWRAGRCDDLARDGLAVAVMIGAVSITAVA